MSKKVFESQFRKELEKKDFYEGVVFESKELEKAIFSWIFKLKKEKGLELNKFTELFWNCKEVIIFPVTMRKVNITDAVIRVSVFDSEDKKYDMDFFRRGRIRGIDYTIAGKNTTRKEYREYCYIIHPKNVITLKSTYAGLLNENGEKQGRKCAIYYQPETKSAKAVLEDSSRKIEITYRAKDTRNDEIVVNYILNAKESFYYKDVIPILKDFMAILGGIKEVIFIEAKIKLEKKEEFFDKEKVYAIIRIEDGDVIDYSPRKINI